MADGTYNFNSDSERSLKLPTEETENKMNKTYLQTARSRNMTIAKTTRARDKSNDSNKQLDSSRAFGHMGHEDWCRKTTIDKRKFAPISKAPRFNDEKEFQKRRDQSPGPTTNMQLTSFLLPDIHRSYVTQDDETGYLENPNYKKYNNR